MNLETQTRIRESLRRYGLFAVVRTMNDAIRFANEYAPEHLEIMTKNPEKLVGKITDAGSVFLGDWTTKSSSDYATGANHVLPTGGMAKMYPHWVSILLANGCRFNDALKKGWEV